MLFLVISLALLQLVSAQQFLWQKPLTEPSLPAGRWEVESEELCTRSHITAYEQVDGPVEFSTSGSVHPEVPRISAINSAAWDQWEFDAVSDSGLAGITMGFSRDASYAFFGQGNLRVEFYIILADGSVVQELDYVDNSTIMECEYFVRGTWSGSGRTYSFHVSRDMKHAKLQFDSSRVQGSFTLISAAPPHFPDGTLFPSDNPSSTQLAPLLYMSQPIAAGRVEADVTISGKRIRFSGMGGHVRVWALGSWFQITNGWHFLRAMAGPYVISYWQPVSRLNRGVSYFSAQLFKDGEVLLATQTGSASDTEDYVLFTDQHGGELSGALHDRSTGHSLEFVSPVVGKSWRFSVEHMKKEFEMGLGGHTGLTGFTNRVTGGETGGLQYEGRALTEQVVLPETIAQWRIWVVLGIGFLGKGKNALMTVLRRIF